MRDVSIAIASALFAAAVMTFGDYVWASRLLPHTLANGLVHGAGLCVAIGLALGAPAGRPLAGATGGIVVGLTAAASFYALAPLMRYSAMFVSWAVLWILMAILARMLRRTESLSTALMRGVVAAIASGLAFYAISGMWTRWNPQSFDYANHFLRWSFAFLPAFLALHVASTKKN
jgi:hypothetical protein